ncbi:hypothetical protein DH2020_048001 [Rehmannia glutinosa]|uniref:Alpha-ketoglutarate-dependent dioxygenase AlkB-like domain-containing protein n=1 Tax=Rehmannia glutinosa TaxID=99300 RepID=A0ABR0U7T6_REHGL
MTNRGMKSRAGSDGNPVNSRNNLTDHEQGQPHLLNEEEYPSLSVSISSKPKSKRRTKIDLGTPRKQRSEDVQNIVPLQFEASTSISHQNDTYLPTSFGKKRSPSSSRNRENYREHGESKRSSMFSPGPNIGEPFDICSPETRESNPLKRSANGKHSGKRWVPKVQSAEENDEQHKGNMEKNNNVDESVEEAEQVLRPGMVLFKRYIPISEQVEIVKRCRELGCGPGGFYRPGYEDGAKLRLYMMCLGLDWNPQTREYGERRQYDNVGTPDIPHEFASLVSRVLNDSHALIKREMKTINVEDILPPMSPDVCIVNFYTTTGRLGLHQVTDDVLSDVYTRTVMKKEKSLLKGLPVVSISIGDSAEFLYGDRRDVNEAEHVLLESGDVLVFGGASRHIFHGVKNIIPNTAPHGLLKHTKLRPGRLNLTFRKY